MSEATWVAVSDVRDENPLAWANGGPCITQHPEFRAVGGFHASECMDCNEGLAQLLNAQAEALAIAGDVCRRIDEFQRTYGERAYAPNSMPGNDYYSSRLMDIVTEARSALARIAATKVQA